MVMLDTDSFSVCIHADSHVRRPMLSHLRQHITTTLENTHSATLATSGPAGLQAHVLRCAASGIQLYLLLPRTSDQLLNLEHDSAVVVATAEWHISGRARVVALA